MNYTYYRRYRPQAKKRPSSFKSFFWLVVALVFVLLLLRACVGLMSSLLEERRDEATLTLNEGSADVLEWGKEDYSEASAAQILLVGDTVRTGSDGLVTLRFAGDMEVHLDASTALLFEDAEVAEDGTVIHLELLSGRAWVDMASEDEFVTLQLKTKLMNIEGKYGRFLIANQDTKQYAYSFEGDLTVDYVDRDQNDSVIETVRVATGQKTILTSEAEVALLARESLTLLGESGDDFLGDRFVMWNLGTVESVLSEVLPGDETGTESDLESDLETDLEIEADPLAEENVETEPEPVTSPVTGLQIRVDSPGTVATIQKSAIAIEGSIASGTANTVTVTWAGNNQPYTLGGFAPGDTSFRYVADASYGNLTSGSNTYTIVAMDADGNVSNTVTVTITAEF